jgi:hypothetical protein
MAQVIDFGIAWEWEYDADFISLFAERCTAHQISTCVINPANLGDLGPKALSGDLGFRVFFDRASDTNADFEPLARHMLGSNASFINYPPFVERAINKATMHLEFISHGINVPYTIILPVFEKDHTEQIFKFDSVGVPFIVKPAHGGGGDGVLLGASSIAEVMAARKDYLNDQILIQQNIIPRSFGGRKAYFRAYFAGRSVYACWWDPQAHVSTRLLPEEMEGYGLGEIERIVARIHEISKLNFFSTEIALTEEMKFISVDYVNEPCDMRLKSTAWDGVPNEVVELICESLAGFVKRMIWERWAVPSGDTPTTG